MIDYNIIAKSVSFYEQRHFVRVESPWTVTKGVSDITRPPDGKEFALKHEDGKVLVASGEQSFLYLYLKGFLPKGKFQTVTPCFRHEKFDSLHSKYFIKNELINTLDVNAHGLTTMIANAQEFFSTYFESALLEVVKTGDLSYDIMYKGVELGSYGIRKCDFLEWVYGTGCAEPRTSATLQKFNTKSNGWLS